MMSTEGEAGRSARAQYEKRVHSAKSRRIKSYGPKLGALLNFLINDSHHVAAWKKGADGEVIVGQFLDKLSVTRGYNVLHDRQIPNSTANIDHILISNHGVFVIDAKNYKGRVELRTIGGLLNNKEVLFVGNRNQTNLIKSVKKQVVTVENLLNESGVNVPVRGVLAFVDAEFPKFFKPILIDEVLINGKGIEMAILSQQELEVIDITHVTKLIGQKLHSKK